MVPHHVGGICWTQQQRLRQCGTVHVPNQKFAWKNEQMKAVINTKSMKGEKTKKKNPKCGRGHLSRMRKCALQVYPYAGECSKQLK